jgi:hypothetical protein
LHPQGEVDPTSPAFTEKLLAEMEQRQLRGVAS